MWFPGVFLFIKDEFPLKRFSINISDTIKNWNLYSRMYDSSDLSSQPIMKSINVEV